MAEGGALASDNPRSFRHKDVEGWMSEADDEGWENLIFSDCSCL